ncbi:penicillin-binding protein 2 [Clostridium sediminicola]|uniref:peptidoglycan D,D-transpeptidase FtsI family protein n=1 Tax=Clostridium sediminicola TaxID=3114879 RepID=UPI0031F1EFF9
MKDISNNVKRVVVFFLVCFICLITYIIYFDIFKATEIKQSVYNRRLWAKRNEVVRGSIFDKNNNVLAETKVDSEGNFIRNYPYEELFAHVIGYVQPKCGLTGLEKSLDKYLIGEEPSNIKSLFSGLDDKKGYNVMTTLDYNVQQKAYDALGNNKGAIVVLNPQTGEIISIVSKPSYNPMLLSQKWSEISNDKDNPLFNLALSGLYPPGSTFKIITAISALENINDVQSRVFEDKGVLVFNDKESISNYNDKAHGNINLSEAFAISSNVIFADLGIELGNSKLKSTAEHLYFNKEIPTDVLSIKKSEFPSLKNNMVGEIAQSAIGQGKVLVTPFQMALVASTVANNGLMKNPYIISEIIDDNGETIKKFSSSTLEQVVSLEDAEIVKEYMRQVVDKGTGKNAQVSNITVCGKTGTSEYMNNSDKTHAWFVGFAPMENPQVAIAVIVENGGTGGGTAAKIAKDIISIAVK